MITQDWETAKVIQLTGKEDWQFVKWWLTQYPKMTLAIKNNPMKKERDYYLVNKNYLEALERKRSNQILEKGLGLSK